MKQSKLVLLLLTVCFFIVKNGLAQTQGPQSSQVEPFVRNDKVKEIIVVFKTHFDIGYTHRVKDLVQYYRTEMIDKALEVMDSSKSISRDQQFRWTAPGWVMSKVMEPWQGQTDERRNKLDKAFREGRFITHAMPFTIETDISEPEVLARGLGFASRLSRQYHLPLPISAKVTDMPSHSGELATVLANAGVKFLHIGCNWPSGYVQTPGIFWWEGPDGSRLLTFYSSNYGTATGLSWPHEWSNGEKFVGRNLLPPADWPYKVWPAILVTMDNSGPPKEEEVKKLFDEVREKMPGVKVRTGTMDEFVKQFLADKPALPVFKKEMPDTWVHGAMCDPGGSKLSRESAPLLEADEMLNTQLKNWGLPAPAISDSVAKAYEMMALYAEHTWGGSRSVKEYGDKFKNQPATAYADLEASWEDKTDYIRNASRIANQIKQDNLKMLAQSVKASPNSLIVYNPLPWQRSGLVEINGESMLVKNIPAGGYTTVPISQKQVVSISSNQFIENQFYKISFDADKGTIQSLIDKRTGYDWAANVSGNQTGAYINERFTYEQSAKYTADYQQRRAWQMFAEKGDWLHPGINKPGMISEKQVPYRKASPSGGKLTIRNSALQQTAIIEMPADTANHLPASQLTVTLVNGEPYFDLEITILNKAKDNWPEADWLALPFNVKNPVFKVYRPLGTMNPATDIATGANKNIYSVGQGVTMTDAEGRGIAVAPLDHPLISLDTTGIWQFSLDFVPKKPIVYLNLYNNQWNTNYRYWYPGTWSSRVRIWSFDRNARAEDRMAVPALEARNPLQVIKKENSSGKLPAQQKGIELSRKGIVVTAYGNDADGNKGTLLRIWEQAGSAGMVTVTLPAGKTFTKAIPVNLRGETNGKSVSIINGKFSCTIKAFGPASFMLQ
ncbi:glycoside hydrolase family 38 C-terminal domain-containing protein [Terrimonas pollutisoli]|uniref:glycoside hydrolase family 38 N-terminal domain-containing protein n=1 Tax=Terrimonas pollutisoli TaxID=3034147 RepID=UPI0023EC9D3E|nr:glycoside hydrolase family 38 C-terminal domain-containing protein [Terrimonas sp. H1YJ31]